jgi:NAD(P)H-hydrate epimerase
MKAFYRAQTSQQIEQYAIQTLGIPGILLMKQAGFFAYQILQRLLEKPAQFSPPPNTHQVIPANTLTILCGTGNNGGDGFIVAQLVKLAGHTVHVCLLGDSDSLKGDALTAYQEMLAIGVTPQPFQETLLHQSDYVVDAIFGIGLNRPITGNIHAVIEQVNQSQTPVLALDIPSGLHANTGTILGNAIQAEHTCTFITQKIGLYSYQGTNVSGCIHYSPLFLESLLTLPHSDFPPIAHNHTLNHWLQKLPPLLATHHKGLAGTVCLVGGNHNMMGAIQLAAQASLNSGAGLVKVITQPQHTLPITQAQPETQCYESSQLTKQLQHANVVAIGPGLGRDQWAQQCYQTALQSNLPKVLDADALNLLAQSPPNQTETHPPQWILTPHPKEAATLLHSTTQTVQNDRIHAIKALHKMYGGVIVLKGNGTLIFDGKNLEICLAGNAGMAVGGMGDTLTGLIASFIAQGLSLWNAANLGVSLHAHSGDQLAQQKSQRGVLPSELALRDLCTRGYSDKTG